MENQNDNKTNVVRDFMEIYLAALKKQDESISIINKARIENELTKYCDRPEFELLFRDLSRTSERVDLTSAFLTLVQWKALEQVGETSEYEVKLTDDQVDLILANNDPEVVSAMQKLVTEIYGISEDQIKTPTK